jgi:prevent-host-death family protein
MGWSIAQAKQRLSEVVRLAAREPQPLYSRGRLVAALIDAESYQAFERWRSGSSESTVARQFDVLRAHLEAKAPSGTGPSDPLPVPARLDRPNAFARMLEEERTPAGPDRDDAAG